MGKISFAFLLLFSFSSCFSHKSPEPANTIHIYSEGNIKSLDPLYADDDYNSKEVSYAYEGLLHYHYLKRPYVVTPNLAEAMPEVSKDGLTFTVKIKKGVLFQDDPCFKESQGKGRELTADDFIYSWKRVADPKNASSGWWIFDGKIAGLNEWHDAAEKAGTADYSKAVEGLQAPDRYTLVIKLAHPNAQFMYMLAMTFSFVVPHEAVEAYGKEFISHAVGTGPYRLSEYNPNSKIIWDRNPTFRHEVYPAEGEPGDKEAGLLADAGQPLPRNDRIVTNILTERQTIWLNFMSGKLDITVIPKDNFGDVVMKTEHHKEGDATKFEDMHQLKPEFKEKGIHLTMVADPDITHNSFNMADPIVGKNKLLRQALSLAYDDNKYIELFYNGRGIPAQGPIPPGLFGYDPNFKNPYRQTNIEKAKEYLARAGYPNGKGLPALEVLSGNSTTDRQSNEFIQQQFAQIGVKLKLSMYSWAEFVTRVKQKQGQIYSWAWLADYPDAENFLQQFYSKNASPGSNDSNYSNPEYDLLYDKLVTTFKDSDRADIIRRMVAIVTEDCPWIFDAHRLRSNLYYPWLKNYKYNAFAPDRAIYYRIDTALRK